MATLDFNMTEQELADALVASSIPKVTKSEKIGDLNCPLADPYVTSENSHIQHDNASDTPAVPVG